MFNEIYQALSIPTGLQHPIIVGQARPGLQLRFRSRSGGQDLRHMTHEVEAEERHPLRHVKCLICPLLETIDKIVDGAPDEQLIVFDCSAAHSPRPRPASSCVQCHVAHTVKTSSSLMMARVIV